MNENRQTANLTVPARVIGRLSIYRRVAAMLQGEGVTTAYSHEIAAAAGVTAAQVRRDLMTIGAQGSPTQGYQLDELETSLGEFLDAPAGQRAALVGVGNLGRAILAHFAGRRPKLGIVAAFDVEPDRTNRVIHGCRCYPMDELREVVRREDIAVGIITVPAAAAQPAAMALADAGVRGILNFAPRTLHLPASVHVEDMDMTMALERVAYFARQGTPRS
jgi:redox-sensing transcriptional repressor